MSTIGRWGRIAALCIAGVSLIPLGIAARSGRTPWLQVFVVMVAVLFVSETHEKFTNEEPVDEDWVSHIRFTVFATILALGGLLLLATGGPGGALLNRLLGLAGAVLGGWMLAAAERDYQRWRGKIRDGG